MVAGLSLAYRGLLRSGRLCDSRLGAFYHAVDRGFAPQPPWSRRRRLLFKPAYYGVSLNCQACFDAIVS